MEYAFHVKMQQNSKNEWMMTNKQMSNECDAKRLSKH